MMGTEFLIQNCSVPNSPFTNPVDVLVQDGIIKSIGNSIRTEYAGIAVKSIDASGMYLLPGLIDCHVHLMMDGSPNIVSYVKMKNVNELTSIAEKNSVRSLESGITTLRDMGCMDFIVPKLRNRIKAGECSGPRIFACGHMITKRRGHVRRIARETDGTRSYVRKIIREQSEGGADFIKLIVSGGILTPGTHPKESELDSTAAADMIKEASGLGLRVAVHAYSDADVKNSLEAGAWTIEHGSWSSPRTLRIGASSNVFFVPAIKAAYNIIENSDSVPNHVVRNASEVLGAARRLIPRAAREGVTIAMGTDAGTPHNRHGENAKELEYMSEFGMSNEDLIAAATTNASNLLGLPRLLGKVDEGYTADLLLLDNNPLDDIRALGKNIRYVIQSGRIIKHPGHGD